MVIKGKISLPCDRNPEIATFRAKADIIRLATEHRGEAGWTILI